MPFRSFLRVQFQKSRQEENVERSIRCFYGENSLQSDLLQREQCVPFRQCLTSLSLCV